MGDHPRSRGVYKDPIMEHWLCGGSSPLARGLHGGYDQHDRVGGIIPARAGFTLGALTAWGYAPGSSPLARGLLGCVRRAHENLGIIPARAGFTPVRGRA